MKDRRLKMVLLPLVIAIWSYTVYKYLFWTEDGGIEPASSVHGSAANPGVESVNDSFSLLGGYRDPFSGKLEVKRPDRQVENTPAPSPTPTPVQSPPAPTIPVMDWSIVRYNGIVQSSGAGSRDGLLSISGKLYHVVPGAVVKGIAVMAMNADSIQLQFADESKTIIKR